MLKPKQRYDRKKHKQEKVTHLSISNLECPSVQYNKHDLLNKIIASVCICKRWDKN